MGSHSMDITKPKKPVDKAGSDLRKTIADQTLHPRDAVWRATSTNKDRKAKKLQRKNRKRGRR